MKNKKPLINLKVFIIILSLMLVSLSSCSNNKEPESIKVGVILPLTGNLAFVGEHFRNGMLCAAEKYNLKGVYFNFEDSKGEPKNGITIFNRMLSEKDYKIIVATLSSVTNSILPFIKNDNILLMTSVVSKSDLPRASDAVFRYFLSSIDETNAMVSYFKKKNINSIGLLYIDDEFGQDALNVFKNSFDGNINVIESFSAQQKDFRPIINKIIASKVKDTYIIGYGSLYSILIKQFKEAGYQGQLYAFSGFGTPVVLSSVGKAGEGVIFTGPIFQPVAGILTAEGSSFIKTYKEKYNEIPDHYAAYGYDMAKLILTVIHGLKEDNLALNVKNLIDKMKSIKEFDGVFGKTTQDIYGDFHFSVNIYKLTEDGKIIKVDM
jgi:branched-chain amino acid transport system substrate-binding protein